jgi:plasmid stability protein
MARVRTTISIDEDLLRALRVRAAREGRADGEVIERALRRDLGFELLDRLWAQNDMDENAARALVQEAITETRRARR